MKRCTLGHLDADGIIDQATGALHRSRTRYEASGLEWTRARISELYELVIASVETRDLVTLIERSRTIAEERFGAGFGIEEVQAAFNVLEEAMWRQVVAATALEDLAETIGLLSTALGAGKDALARTYVSLASERRVPSLDLSAMFKGTTG
jgi:hypothetical protein